MRAVAESAGITTMLPTEDAAWVGEELARRFGVPYWQFSLTATDANRWMLRICRHVTGSAQGPRLQLVLPRLGRRGLHHARAPAAGEQSREGNVGPQVDPATTTRVAEFNDLESVEAALAHGDVACVLMEPALTNIGIVLPEAGFLDGGARGVHPHRHAADHRRDAHAQRRPGRLHRRLGPRARRRHARQVDRRRRADRRLRRHRRAGRSHRRRRGRRLEDTGGVGGTLAGNALSLAATRATLGEVLTDEAFARMSPLRERFVGGVEDALERRPSAVVRSSASARAPSTASAPSRRAPAPSRRRRPTADARGISAPVPAQPRRADHAVPQHGADVPGDDRGRGRPPHRGIQRAVKELSA